MKNLTRTGANILILKICWDERKKTLGESNN